MNHRRAGALSVAAGASSGPSGLRGQEVLRRLYERLGHNSWGVRAHEEVTWASLADGADLTIWDVAHTVLFVMSRCELQFLL